MNSIITDFQDINLKKVDFSNIKNGEDIFNYEIIEGINKDTNLAIEGIIKYFGEDINKNDETQLIINNIINKLRSSGDIFNKLISNSIENQKNRSQKAKLIKINRENQKEIISDSLTGCYNRKYADIKLKDIVEMFNRNSIKSSIALIDIDNFKKLNDEYGHQYGDKVLKSLVKIINKNIRKTDILCRVGGEEFLIIFPNTEIKDAEYKMNQIKNLIEENLYKCCDENILRDKISISGGVTKTKKELTEHHIYQNADIALYAAKNNGKNQIVRHKNTSVTIEAKKDED